MALLLIPIIILVVIVQGVRVLRGRYPVSDPRRDEASVRQWMAARKRGYWMHSLRSVGVYVLGCCIVGPLVESYRQSERVAYPLHVAPYWLGLGVVVALVGGFFSWKILESEAHEAQQRLQAPKP